ncbi:prolyl oligopeptidase family serine peptidase [Aquiflexum sp.]|uniref:prolyl oligopeptidase family serine peptidase n=1 Tax=Aquiflexum sp. TaxID=1872584 RepID=UPI003593BF36
MGKAFMRSITGSLFLVLLLFSCQENEEPGLDARLAIDLLDVKYSEDRPNQLLDIYLPANRNSNTTKVFVWIHGGGWIDGNKSEFKGFKPWLEEVQDDYAYIAINYSLYNISSGSNRFPTQEEDIKKALAYIKSQLSTWNVSDQVVLAGGSAGGHLALLHSYRNNEDKLVKATVAFFPPTDLTAFYGFSLFTNLLLENIMGGNPTNRKEVYFNGSPLNFVDSQSVPTVLFHGDTDTVVPISQSKILEEALIAKNVLHMAEYVIGQGHGFSAQTNKELIGKMQGFLEGVLD